MGESHLIRRQAGAEEKVVAQSFGGDDTPIDWLVRAVAGSARTVLDLACGTGTLTNHLARPGRLVVGVDLSPEHLAAAQPVDGVQFVRGDATRLPIADGTVDAVVSSLGLGVVTNRRAFLREVVRVLRPGGVFAGLTPASRPFSVEDLRVASQLAAHLRVPPTLPGQLEFNARSTLAQVGLTAVEDARARYHFVVKDRADAELLISGLRVPSDSFRGGDAVEFLVRRARNRPVRVPLPMRRIVAIK